MTNTRERGPVLDAVERLMNAAHRLSRLQGPQLGISLDDLDAAIGAGMSMVILGAAALANISETCGGDIRMPEETKVRAHAALDEAFAGGSIARTTLAEVAARVLTRLANGVDVTVIVTGGLANVQRKPDGEPS